jgi:hypothetical protein
MATVGHCICHTGRGCPFSLLVTELIGFMGTMVFRGCSNLSCHECVGKTSNVMVAVQGAPRALFSQLY